MIVSVKTLQYIQRNAIQRSDTQHNDIQYLIALGVARTLNIIPFRINTQHNDIRNNELLQRCSA
jgi:hypothetical protein